MFRKYSPKPWLMPQRLRREMPVDQYNGCLTADSYARELFETMQSTAVEFSTLWESGNMPVLKYDANFRAWRDEQISANETLTNERITCTLPWQVLKHIGDDRKESNRLYWSQGGLGSCVGHADAFAWHSSVLYGIARGAPLRYCPINPVVTWGITKRGSLRGGQTVSEMAQGANELGHFPESLVGTNNQAMPDFKSHLDAATKYQSSILFLDFEQNELANEIVECCKAGLSVVVGNSNAVSGSKRDANGVKVAVVSGTWYHATHFTAYRRVNGTEYVGWVNSHGNQYPISDEGEPADMAWMDRKSLEKFASTMHHYGPPYVVFPESVTVQDRSFTVQNSVSWPANWRF